MRSVPRLPVQMQQRRCLFGWLFGRTPEAEQRTATRPGGAGLPAPQAAQRLSAVRLPRFLSDDEIAQILRVSSEIRRDGAGAVRLHSSPSMSADGSLPSWDQEGYETDRGEWSTTYLLSSTCALCVFVCVCVCVCVSARASVTHTLTGAGTCRRS